MGATLVAGRRWLPYTGSVARSVPCRERLPARPLPPCWAGRQRRRIPTPAVRRRSSADPPIHRSAGGSRPATLYAGLRSSAPAAAPAPAGADVESRCGREAVSCGPHCCLGRISGPTAAISRPARMYGETGGPQVGFGRIRTGEISAAAVVRFHLRRCRFTAMAPADIRSAPSARGADGRWSRWRHLHRQRQRQRHRHTRRS